MSDKNSFSAFNSDSEEDEDKGSNSDSIPPSTAEVGIFNVLQQKQPRNFREDLVKTIYIYPSDEADDLGIFFSYMHHKKKKINLNIGQIIADKIRNQEILTLKDISVIVKAIHSEYPKYLSEDAVIYFNRLLIQEENESLFVEVNNLIKKKLKDPENPDNIEWSKARNKISKKLEFKINTNRKITDESEKLEYFTYHIEPLISKLISIFLIHSGYFSAARYLAISSCEELLAKHFLDDALRMKLLYILANLNSYIGDEWRRDPYKQEFLRLQSTLQPQPEFPSIQDERETSHNGLKKLLHFLQNKDSAEPSQSLTNSARRSDAYRLNVFDIDLTTEDHRITAIKSKETSPDQQKSNIKEWKDIPKFTVITGVNGIGKTKILDSINEELRNSEEGILHIYANSESDMLRNVFGKKGNDFKVLYVYEKIAFYLSFQNYKKRESVLKFKDSSLNCKIALAIVDKLLCNMGNRLLNRQLILNNFPFEKEKEEQIEYLSSHLSERFILEVAEDLAFKLNAIIEPISFTKNLCLQHLKFIQDKYNKDKGLKLENNNEHDKTCSTYCENAYAVIPPIKNINSILQRYLSNFYIDFKWTPNYKYKLLFDSQELYDSSEIVFFLEDSIDGKELKYQTMDMDSAEIIGPKDINSEIYNKIINSLENNIYINLDDDMKEVIDFITTKGHTPGGYELTFHKGISNQEIHPQNLSSGELVIIKLILWAYVSKGLNFLDRLSEVDIDLKITSITPENESQQNEPNSVYIQNGLSAETLSLLAPLPTKLKLLLLDEIDKHFDSKLINILMLVLRNEFKHKHDNTQIIMTTHRLESVVLVDDNELFAIREEEQKTVIKPCTKLLAQARLVREVQTHTGMHIKVYTESFDDAKFYEGIYANLLKYANMIRKVKLPTVTNLDPFLEELSTLSRRYKMGFYPASFEKGTAGGWEKVFNAVRTSIAASAGSASSETYSNTNSLVSNMYRAYQADAPFGIIDRDYTNRKLNINPKDGALSNPFFVSNKIERLSRHSLECFMYDPVMLCSVFSNIDEINTWFEPSSFRMYLKSLYRELFHSHLTIDTINLQMKLNLIYLEIFKTCLNENRFIKAFKEQIVIIITAKYNGNYEVRFESMAQEIVEKFLLNTDDHYKTLVPDSSIIPQGTNGAKISIKNVVEIAKKQIKEFNHYYHKFAYSDGLKEVYQSMRQELATNKLKLESIDYVFYQDGEVKKLPIKYPTSLKYLRGHHFRYAINEFIVPGLEDMMLSKIMQMSLDQKAQLFIPKAQLFIPVDLARTILDLNYNIKAQVIAKADPEKFRERYLGLPINFNLKQVEKHFLFFTQTAKLLKDLLSLNTAHKLFIDDLPMSGLYPQESNQVRLIPEDHHILSHKNNILLIIEMINNGDITSNTVICLERKQNGSNLGMADVAILANLIADKSRNEIYLPQALKVLPIYYDAILYNIAKAKNILVIGIEAKGLPYSKRSIYYNKAREEYMAKALLDIVKLGYHPLFLVGSAHLNNLQKLLELKTDSNHIRPIKQVGMLLADTALPTNFLVDYFNKLLNQFDLTWQLKKLYHYQEVQRFNSILKECGSTESTEALRNGKSFNKILLKLHPDKGGNKDDFTFMQNLRDKFNKEINIDEIKDNTLKSIQSLSYQAMFSLKILDATVDTARLYYKPTLENAQKVVIDSANSYSLYSGANGYSAIITIADISYKTHQGEYTQAIQQFSSMLSYMAIPVVIESVGSPYLSFMFSSAITIYTGYNAITNAYRFYSEYNSENFELKSNIAYKNFYQSLSDSMFQEFYDFTASIEKYETKVSNSKYDSLHKTIQDKSIETRHTHLNTESQQYEHCLQVIEPNEEKSEHYYCYNEEQETIDHVVIGDNIINI